MEKPDSYIGIYLKKFRENRKAISPVISTIIIVAVAIAIAIAVAFWLGGITSIFTRFEKLEIPTAYAKKSDTTEWEITLYVNNTGTTDTSVTLILINGIDSNEYNFALETGTTLPISIKTGEGTTIKFTISPDANFSFSSGQSVTITLHTSGGQDYPKTVVLP